MSKFRIFQDRECAKVLNSQGYRGFTYFRKYGKIQNMRLDVIIEGKEVLYKPPCRRVLNIPGLPTIQVATYARITQGSE